MDDLDRKILERIQKEFPIAMDPYSIISEELQISREELIKRIRDLQNMGIIKKIIPIMTEKYYRNIHRSLIGISVDELDVENISSYLRKRNEITHIYLRENFYNIWFTFLTNDEESLKRFENEFLKSEKIKKYIILNSEVSYKLNVKFKVSENGDP
ncbi:MAG: Lrp/AsnC family transcriptional regulator [Thermoplasmata archaeon]